MVFSMTTPTKKKALLEAGTLNPHPEAVQSDLFKRDFFDPGDRAQVRYEMLRAHSVDGDPITEVDAQPGGKSWLRGAANLLQRSTGAKVCTAGIDS